MRKIYKYEIDLRELTQQEQIMMPQDAKLLMVACQNRNVVTAWFEVNTSNPCVTKYFSIYGTGHKIREDSVYMGSCLDDQYVWHLYENITGDQDGAVKNDVERNELYNK